MEIVAAIMAFFKAFSETVDLVKLHAAKIAALEAQVQKHDAQLEHATLPVDPASVKL